MKRFTLDGVNGQMHIYDNKVEIIRKGVVGFMTHGLAGIKTLPMKNITSVQVKFGTFWTNGYIQLNTVGKVESDKGMFAATHDENTVFFKKGMNSYVQEIKDFIEQNIL